MELQICREEDYRTSTPFEQSQVCDRHATTLGWQATAPKSGVGLYDARGSLAIRYIARLFR